MVSSLDGSSAQTRPGQPLDFLDVEKNDNNDDHSVPSSESQGASLQEWLISISIILCQFVQMIPYGAGVSGATNIASQLGASPKDAVWITASYPLTQGTFVLIGGRLGAIYGHKNMVLVAGAWWVIFHLISGFMRSVVALSVMRALSGIGGGFILPNAIALLTIKFPPGRMRNLSIGLFGSMAPIGAAGGSVFPGFFGQLAPWWWLFFFLAILGTLIFTLFFFVVPSEGKPMNPSGKMDYVGAYLGVAGLILFNFVWTQASIVGWTTPYIYALLVVSMLHFALFVLREARFAIEPILPMAIWKSSSFMAMITAVFLTLMAVGIVIWYIAAWDYNIRGYSILLNAAVMVPLAVCGALAAVLSAIAVRYIAAQYIMAIGSLASCVSLVLISTMPEQQTYWAQVFPAVLIIAFGPDFLFTAAQIIASNTVGREEQGAAGSLIGTVVSYGLSTGLGFAGTVEYYTGNAESPAQGYRNGMYLGIGMAGLAILLALLFVRIPKDERDGWDEQEATANPNSR